ncbi:MAG: biotin/lipoyl-binding protein, partial [Magnetospirillum sp.]
MTSQSLVTVPEQTPAPTAEPPPPAIKQSSRQSRHLAQAVQLEESGTAPLVRFTMLIASVATCAFIVWSYFTNVDEVAIAEGSIFPSGLIQQIQHLEGGIVDEVMVREGQLVEAGQPLVRLNPAQAIADLEQTRAREATLLLKAERLRAFAEGRQPDFSVGGKDYERLVADNQSIFETALRSRESARAIILAQIEQKRSDLRTLDTQVKALREQAGALREELRMREELVAKGLVTRIIYLDNKRELARVEGEATRVTGQMASAREALAEVENRLTDHQSTL